MRDKYLYQIWGSGQICVANMRCETNIYSKYLDSKPPQYLFCLNWVYKYWDGCHDPLCVDAEKVEAKLSHFLVTKLGGNDCSALPRTWRLVCSIWFHLTLSQSAWKHLESWRVLLPDNQIWGNPKADTIKFGEFRIHSQGVVALVSVSDGKTKITILILRRGTCLRRCSIDGPLQR